MPDFKDCNHSLIQLVVSALALFVAFEACIPEENNTGSSDNGKDKTVHVTGISLSPISATIKEGESISITAAITPDNVENKAISWSSNSDAVATVDANGRVTGVKAGSATITATAEDGGVKATCAISVEANLAPSVTVNANHISAISAVLAGKANLSSTVAADLQVGFQYSKSAGILPSNSTTVEATDADASYNYTTIITGLEPDTKYYFRSFVRQNSQYTYGETKEFTTKDVASLLETKDASAIEAAKATLNAKLDLTDVQYKSLVYGFYWGTSESGQDTFIDGGDITDHFYVAEIINLSHQTQYWYKAYVNLDGQKLYGNLKHFITATVPVESVVLDKTEYTFNTIGSILSLNATVLPDDATDKRIEWTSSNEDVATVDQNGNVKAIGNGTATITAKTKDQGKTANCAIRVAQLITSIVLDHTTITLQVGEEQLIIPAVSPDNASDRTLKWTSSNETVATVDQTGKVTALSQGVTTIKAEAQDGSGIYATCAVSVYTKYVRMNIGFRFTATWCGYCPYMDETFHKVAEDPANHFGYITFHTSSGYPLYLAAASTFMSYYNVQGYPTAVLNGWKEINNNLDTDLNAANVVGYIKDFEENFPCFAGISVSASVTGSTLSAEATVCALSGNYIIAAFVLESGIVEAQSYYPTSGGSQKMTDYVHDNVARAVLTASAKGDSFYVGAEQRTIKWSKAISSEWVPANLSVAVVLMRQYGALAGEKTENDYPNNYVINSVIVPVGSSKDMEYAQ